MLGIIFLIGSILLGIGLVKKAFPFADGAERVFWGMSVGILLSSWAAYLVSRVLFEMNYAALIVLLAAIWIAAIFLLRKSFGAIWQIDLVGILKENRFLLALFVVFLPIFFYFFYEGMFRARADGLYIMAMTWGDITLHLAIANSFAYANNFPPMYVLMPGESLHYPFLADFHAAIFLKFGWTLWQSFAVTAFVSVTALFGTFYCFARRLAESNFAAFLASLMFFLMGGFGFLKFFKDWSESGKSFFGYFFDMKENYTAIFSENVSFGNIMTLGISPQRAMLYGMPIAFIVLAIFAMVWKDWTESESSDKSKHWQTLFFAGFLTGLLPLYHAHSYMAIGLISGFLFLARPRLVWFAFWIPAVLLAVPQIFGGGGTLSSTEFIQYNLGWTYYGVHNFIVYLLLNFGLPLILIFPALIFAPKHLRTFYLPFAAIFLLCFLFKISPNAGDNAKLLFYWYAATVIIIAVWLNKLARMPKVRFLLIPIVLICCAAGFLATVRESKNINRVFSPEEIEAGIFSRDETAPRALFLTGQNLNQPALCLAGRQILLGDSFWVSSHGYNRQTYDAIKKDVQEIYIGSAKSEALIEKYKVDYVYIGPGERNDLHASELYFATNHTLVFKNREISIYKIQKSQN